MKSESCGDVPLLILLPAYILYGMVFVIVVCVAVGLWRDRNG